MIEVLRSKTPAEVRAAVAGFAEKYVHDWDRWRVAAPSERPSLFVKTLGKWQATRPRRLRRLRVRGGEHPPPHIEDLLEDAGPHLSVLAGFHVGRIKPLSARERRALGHLWAVFCELQQSGGYSCVAITKAVLLLSDGRIGPAFDSQVRSRLGLAHLQTPNDWISALGDVTEDIRAFEAKHGTQLPDTVPRRFSSLATGRLYDMALGPR